MPSLQDYIDVDSQVDCTERMTDQEIVAEVLIDRLNPESDDEDQLSETPIDESNQYLRHKPFKLLSASDNSLFQWTTTLLLLRTLHG